jgi:hypothetical protein
MHRKHLSESWSSRYWREIGSLVGVGLLVAAFTPWPAQAAPPGPYSTEYPITVDPTGLTPPTRWHVPGVTPIIATLDPEYTDAYSTTERAVVKLKPGQYRFGTFTFDFPFRVTLEGVLDYSSSLDQCVDGRGTTTLTVRCSRTQPYGGEPDYKY